MAVCSQRLRGGNGTINNSTINNGPIHKDRHITRRLRVVTLSERVIFSLQPQYLQWFSGHWPKAPGYLRLL